jgi:NAD(P)-dependent dehydrogenase (short-subunit alcohol dehydrogenase family)
MWRIVMSKLTGKRVVIVGGSEGLGRELVVASRAAGAQVLAIARRDGPLAKLAREEPGTVTQSIDATDDDAPDRVFAALTPDVLVICAGAHPAMGPVQSQSWEQFSTNWNADVKASFVFCRAALRKPLAPGSTVVLISSGAGLGGSRLSGGYAGAKRMQMFLAEYAQEESDRLGLGIRFLAVVPRRIMPTTALGALAVEGYSSNLGLSPAQFIERMEDAQTPAQVATAFVELVSESPSREGNVFAVSAAGIAAVP